MRKKMPSSLGLAAVATCCCLTPHGFALTPIILLTNAPVAYVLDAPKLQPFSFVGSIGPQETTPYGSNYHHFAVSIYTDNVFRTYSIWLSRPVPECRTAACVAEVSGVLKDGYIGTYTMEASNVTVRETLSSWELSPFVRSSCEQCITDALPRLMAIKPETLSTTPGFVVCPNAPPQCYVEARDIEAGLALVKGGRLFTARRQPAFKTDIYAEHICYDLLYDERSRTVKAIWVHVVAERGPPD